MDSFSFLNGDVVSIWSFNATLGRMKFDGMRNTQIDVWVISRKNHDLNLARVRRPIEFEERLYKLETSAGIKDLAFMGPLVFDKSGQFPFLEDRVLVFEVEERSGGNSD
jgi:hypothetical protein